MYVCDLEMLITPGDVGHYHTETQIDYLSGSEIDTLQVEPHLDPETTIEKKVNSDPSTMLLRPENVPWKVNRRQYV